MTRLTKIIAILVCLLLAVTLVSCGSNEEQINEAVKEVKEELSATIDGLNERIEELEADIDTLEGEKSALEAEKSALEAEKSALEAELDAKIKASCAGGVHVRDESVAPTYIWAYSEPLAEVKCIYGCDYDVWGRGSIEDGKIIAEFDDGIPGAELMLPVFTEMTFESESAEYDETTNTLSVNPGQSLVLTIRGTNLDSVSALGDYYLAVNFSSGSWNVSYKLQKDDGVVSISDSEITLTLTHEALNGMWEIGGILAFGVADLSKAAVLNSPILYLNIPKYFDPDTVYTVTTAEELIAQANIGGRIELGADIMVPDGVDIRIGTTVEVDLAGYSLTSSRDSCSAFWVYGDLKLYDSVGTGILYPHISIYEGGILRLGTVRIDCLTKPINFNGGALDLTDYEGEEMYLFAAYVEDIILGEGYAFYTTNGELIEDIHSVVGKEWFYIRRIDQQS